LLPMLWCVGADGLWSPHGQSSAEALCLLTLSSEDDWGKCHRPAELGNWEGTHFEALRGRSGIRFRFIRWTESKLSVYGVWRREGESQPIAVWDPYVVIDMFASRESTFLDRAIK
jgi:hypothetical protein